LVGCGAAIVEAGLAGRQPRRSQVLRPIEEDVQPDDKRELRVDTSNFGCVAVVQFIFWAKLN
jgi:hypothetical protein